MARLAWRLYSIYTGYYRDKICFGIHMPREATAFSRGVSFLGSYPDGFEILAIEYAHLHLLITNCFVSS